MTRHYRVHGLLLESEIDLPDLVPASAGEVDVTVLMAPDSDDESDGGEDVASSDFAAFDIPSVARYEISDGRHILVQPRTGADPRTIRLFLLGSAMGLLLHQRGLFVLHAAAGVIDGKAVAVTGASGEGKSSFALAIRARGYALLSDDMLVIRHDGAGAHASRAVRRMRLCPDVMTAQGLEPDQFPLSYAPEEDRTKHDVAMGDAPDTVPLAVIVELAEGLPSLELLEGADAVDRLMANSFRGLMLAPGRQREVHFRSAIALAKTVRVYRLRRPRDLQSLPAQVEQLVNLTRNLG